METKSDKKMKRTFFSSIIFVVMFVCAVSLLSSFSPPQSEVEGYPTIYGTEPNTFLGLKTVPKDGESVRYYRIKCSAEEEKALRNMQGFVVRIKGRIISNDKTEMQYGPDVLDDGVIVLSSWSKK